MSVATCTYKCHSTDTFSKLRCFTCILSGLVAVHHDTGCIGLRAGGGKKAVVCGLNACKGLVGSVRLPESASDTC